MINIDRLCPGCMSDNGGEKICSICGFDAASKNDSFCLPIKFSLSDRFIIGKVVSINAEGITYIAYDIATDVAVHIKEYFPKEISVRNPDKTVSVKSGNEFYFNEGLMDFIEINKKLIATELQAIVPVHTVFEENGTVYAVMPIITGITLDSFLDRNGGSLRWEQARPLFLPLIDTIKGLHEIGIIHGGISPATILVGRDGKLRFTGILIPRLRMASPNSAAELYSGYAAVEQYGMVDATLSEASDVYGLSATLFRVIIGVNPPSSNDRLRQDSLSIPARFADELPRQVLVAMANGMQVKIENRTRSIDVFKDELVYGETQENIRRSASARTASQAAKSSSKENTEKKTSGFKYVFISAGVTAAVFLIAGIILFSIFKDDLMGSGEKTYNNSDVVSIPEGDQLGDVDPDAVESAVLYEIPDLKGMYVHELEDLDNYKRFKFVIKDTKVYTDADDRGKICAQSVKPGSMVAKGKVIELTISLGKKEFSMPDVIGLEEKDAIIELLSAGFLYENIEVETITGIDDANVEAGQVAMQTPEDGETVTAEALITIYIKLEDESEQEQTDGASESEDEEDDRFGPNGSY